MKSETITIVGGGSMGTALGKVLGEAAHPVKLWVYEPELADEINRTRRNSVFLPDAVLPENLQATSSLEQALSGARLVLSVTPSQVLRTVWQAGRPFLHPEAVVVSASKGIEVHSTMLMSEVLAEVLGDERKTRCAYLSGPSFATELAAGHPTTVVIASLDATLATTLQQNLATAALRLYTTEDVVGVELGGALKNVIAIAVGAAEGMGLGHNTRAALITRGLAEISRLAVAAGANPLTLAGLAGVGDLVLTCTGHLSRNLQVGIRLGRGEPLAEILASTKMVAEGVETARSTVELARKRGVEMPISETVVRFIDGELTAAEAVRGLMSRRLRSEREF